ncbi:MAG: hypothetical protein ACFFFG_13010 [Candidatus Thorarchaeota archaeon]
MILNLIGHNPPAYNFAIVASVPLFLDLKILAYLITIIVVSSYGLFLLILEKRSISQKFISLVKSYG